MFNNVNAQLMFQARLLPLRHSHRTQSEFCPITSIQQYSTAYFNPYEVKHRKRTSRAQLTVLEATFQENNKPSSHVKKALASQLDMPIRNVQVWFQNRCTWDRHSNARETNVLIILPIRRAKDKNLALKRAKALAAGEIDPDDVNPADGDDLDGEGEGGNGESSRTGSEAETAADSHSPNPDKDDQQTPVTESDPTSISLLVPPANIPLRRGSVPNIPFSPSSHSTSPSQSRTFISPPARTISEFQRPPPQSQPLQIPVASLARRQSLPAFHHNAPRPVQAVPALPSLTGTPDSNSPSVDHGHGGVYRSPSFSRLNGPAVAPYPIRTGPPGTGYRTGSTPGTGVFRVPTNPLPNGTSTNTWIELHARSDAPYAFPPRPYADLPNTGPLPSKDFRFGDSSVGTSSMPHPHNPGSAPNQNTSEDEERIRNLAQGQSHRFGSFTSELSIESDATGTSATTATSSNGFSALNNLALPGSLGSGPPHPYRARYPGGPGIGFGYGVGQHQHLLPQHANSIDSGLGTSISYGMDAPSGSIAGLSAGPVHFPAKFDPESRRASWYV